MRQPVNLRRWVRVTLIALALLVAAAATGIYFNRFTDDRVSALEAAKACVDCDLSLASIWWADLREANLDGADLSHAMLWWSDLRGASLRNARLAHASLWWGDLRGADFSGAAMKGASLRRAEARGARMIGSS